MSIVLSCCKPRPEPQVTGMFTVALSLLLTFPLSPCASLLLPKEEPKVIFLVSGAHKKLELELELDILQF